MKKRDRYSQKLVIKFVCGNVLFTKTPELILSKSALTGGETKIIKNQNKRLIQAFSKQPPAKNDDDVIINEKFSLLCRT